MARQTDLTSTRVKLGKSPTPRVCCYTGRWCCSWPQHYALKKGSTGEPISPVPRWAKRSRRLWVRPLLVCRLSLILSHFHLDRTLSWLCLPADGTLGDILQAVPLTPAEQASVSKSVAVYCNPKTYPSPQRLLDLEGGIAVAVGIHPRHASSLTKDRLTGVLDRLKTLLDHTVSECWER